MATDPEYRFGKDREKSGQLNFNTVAIAIVLATLAWIGSKTVATNDAVTKIETTLPYVTASVNDLKTQIASLVSRAELESRMSEMASKNALLETRVMKLEYGRREDVKQ